MKENARTVKTVVIVGIMCLLVLGYYAYLSNKSLKSEQDKQLTETEELLLYDLDKEYPYSPRDVVKLYSRMMICVYNERLESEELESMVSQMRVLYADEFANDANNSKDNQISNLKKEIEEYTDEDKITNYVLSEVSQVEYGTVENQECALVDATYTIRMDNKYSKLPQTYVLVKDDQENWKILGWQTETAQEETTEE